MRFILGVDEAGRGPLAGPIMVGTVAAPENFIIVREFPGLADSKQLTQFARERIFRLLQKRARDGDLQFCVRSTSAERIDAWGLSRAIARATARSVNAIAKRGSLTSSRILKADFRILLDGSLHAPPEYNQQTIIGGDESVPIIALASIAAKVTRDRLMTRLAKLFPEYGFDGHKGYGTRAHYAALKKHGPCPLHRRSFLH